MCWVLAECEVISTSYMAYMNAAFIVYRPLYLRLFWSYSIDSYSRIFALCHLSTSRYTHTAHQVHSHHAPCDEWRSHSLGHISLWIAQRNLHWKWASNWKWSGSTGSNRMRYQIHEYFRYLLWRPSIVENLLVVTILIQSSGGYTIHILPIQPRLGSTHPEYKSLHIGKEDFVLLYKQNYIRELIQIMIQSALVWGVDIILLLMYITYPEIMKLHSILLYK